MVDARVPVGRGGAVVEYVVGAAFAFADAAVEEVEAVPAFEDVPIELCEVEVAAFLEFLAFLFRVCVLFMACKSTKYG